MIKCSTILRLHAVFLLSWQQPPLCANCSATASSHLPLAVCSVCSLTMLGKGGMVQVSHRRTNLSKPQKDKQNKRRQGQNENGYVYECVLRWITRGENHVAAGLDESLTPMLLTSLLLRRTRSMWHRLAMLRRRRTLLRVCIALRWRRLLVLLILRGVHGTMRR